MCISINLNKKLITPTTKQKISKLSKDKNNQ